MICSEFVVVWSEEFPRSTQFAKTIADRPYYLLFDFTRIAHLTEWDGGAPLPGESGLGPQLHTVLQPVAEFIRLRHCLTPS